jgi:hypothetical protein
MSFDKKEFYARTMHTPDSPERAAMRSTLRELSKTLIPLHRHLIDAAKSDYSFAYAAVESPGQLLQLLNDHAFFAWLKPMTSIIVEIDEMVRRDFEAADARAIAARVEAFLSAKEYVEMLQREIDIAAGHAQVRKLLTRLAQ